MPTIGDPVAVGPADRAQPTAVVTAQLPDRQSRQHRVAQQGLEIDRQVGDHEALLGLGIVRFGAVGVEEMGRDHLRDLVRIDPRALGKVTRRGKVLRLAVAPRERLVRDSLDQRLYEPELAALAAERGTEDEFREIEQLARQMEQDANAGHDFAEFDVQFHSSIVGAARNPILDKLMEGVSDLFLESRRNILMDPQAMLRSARYHLLIVDALIARNASQARLLMQAHMNSMLDDVLAMEKRKQTRVKT